MYGGTTKDMTKLQFKLLIYSEAWENKKYIKQN